jgi:hypothetical protein
MNGRNAMSNTPLDQVLKAKADYESKRQAAISDLLAKRAEIDKQLEALGHEETAAPKRRGRRGPMSEATREKMRLAWKRRKEAATKGKKG